MHAQKKKKKNKCFRVSIYGLFEVSPRLCMHYVCPWKVLHQGKRWSHSIYYMNSLNIETISNEELEWRHCISILFFTSCPLPKSSIISLHEVNQNEHRCLVKSVQLLGTYTGRISHIGPTLLCNQSRISWCNKYRKMKLFMWLFAPVTSQGFDTILINK